MDTEFARLVTLAIAVWGALTGTVALIIETRKYRRDRPRLVPLPSFELSYSDKYPPAVSFKLTISNVGRRPVFLRDVWGRADTATVWRRLYWRLRGRGWFPLSNHKIPGTQLVEGQSVEFRLSPPNGVYSFQIIQVAVVDQTGKRWLSTKKFGRKEIREMANAVTLHEEDIKGAVRDRSVFIQHIRQERSEGVLLKATNENTTKWRMPRWETSPEAAKTLERAKQEAEAFVEGTIDDPVDRLNA